jgi:hypothetical protein
MLLNLNISILLNIYTKTGAFGTVARSFNMHAPPLCLKALSVHLLKNDNF